MGKDWNDYKGDEINQLKNDFWLSVFFHLCLYINSWANYWTASQSPSAHRQLNGSLRQTHWKHTCLPEKAAGKTYEAMIQMEEDNVESLISRSQLCMFILNFPIGKYSSSIHKWITTEFPTIPKCVKSAVYSIRSFQRLQKSKLILHNLTCIPFKSNGFALQRISTVGVA